MLFPTFNYELKKLAAGKLYVAGCDEVGIGPLAGPVVGAAVILNSDQVKERRANGKWWARVRDSKTVNEKERNDLYKMIMENCVAQSVGVVAHGTIDKINIHQAAMLAMRRAVDGLSKKPDYIFLDGRFKIKDLDVAQEAVIGGDSKILSIAAASIIAKVTRDKILTELHEKYPQYNFHQNKGYGTKFHCEALMKYGPCEVHRKSFGLVKQIVLGVHPNY